MLSETLLKAVYKESEGIDGQLGVREARGFCRDMNGSKLKQAHGVVGHHHRGRHFG
jgi:hypothetical protein